MSQTFVHPSSYRDPSGFIFINDGVLYRQVNIVFKEHFDHFIQSGCYDQLVKKGLLLAHTDIDANLTSSPLYYQTLRPEEIPFLSYPYEWSFDMLRDAALLTLQLVKESVAFGMILKDASPYNVQWYKGKLTFIDTLSFKKHDDGPWIAYRQFCECFLAPMLLMHYSNRQIPELFLAWPDGIPLDTASALLPKRSKFSLDSYLHIHLHARIARKKPNGRGSTAAFSRQKLINLIRSLELLINRLKAPKTTTAWSGYYEEAARRNDYLEQKKEIIKGWVDSLANINTAVDLGANNGEFSGLLAEKGISVLAADMDPYCINDLYNNIRNQDRKNIQPIVIDLSHPSPSIGVNNQERISFAERLDADLAMALALIHHLAIGKNIPFDMIAETFSRAGKKLLVEFVPKDDDKIKLMLTQKEDVYSQYSESNFVKAFERYFKVEDKKQVGDSGRVLYLMTRNEG